MQLLQPDDTRVIVDTLWSLGLVLPVRSDTELGARMHICGANLNLYCLAVRTYNGCMERLIKVELGHCNVILEATRNRAPAGVYRSENCIAITDIIDDNPDSN